MPSNWEKMIGEPVAGRYRLLSITAQTEDQAEFIAMEPGGEPVTALLVKGEPAEVAALASDMSGVARFQHPNILKTLEAGEWASQDTPFAYMITERAEESLAERARAALDAAAARPVARDVLAGLKYLHDQGVAYGNLEPATVVRAGGRWKLADLSSLAPGMEAPADIRAFGAMLEAIAPGAFGAVLTRCQEAAPERQPSIPELQALLADPIAAPPKPRGRVKWVAAGVLFIAIACAFAAYVRLRTAPAAGPAVEAAEETETEPEAPAQKPSPMAPPYGSARPEESQPASKPSASPEGSHAAQPSPPPEDSEAPAEEPSAKPVDESKLATAKPSPADAAADEGLADFASNEMNGRRTASGELFNSAALTAAHSRYPMGTRLKVTNPKNGREIVVRVNDRGGFRRGYIIRLTRRGAEDLGIAGTGSARVRVEAANGGR